MLVAVLVFALLAKNVRGAIDAFKQQTPDIAGLTPITSYSHVMEFFTLGDSLLYFVDVLTNLDGLVWARFVPLKRFAATILSIQAIVGVIPAAHSLASSNTLCKPSAVGAMTTGLGLVLFILAFLVHNSTNPLFVGLGGLSSQSGSFLIFSPIVRSARQFPLVPGLPVMLPHLACRSIVVVGTTIGAIVVVTVLARHLFDPSPLMPHYSEATFWTRGN